MLDLDTAMATRENVESFTIEEVCELVCNKLEYREGVDDIVDELRSNYINGKTFLNLSQDDIKEMLRPIGHRKALTAIIQSYRPVSVNDQPRPTIAESEAPQEVNRN